MRLAADIGLRGVILCIEGNSRWLAGEMRWCPPSERRMPSGAQAPGIETAQMRDLVLKGD